MNDAISYSTLMPIRDPSLLVMAAFGGNLDRIDRLLRAGADVEARHETWNPLHAAIENVQLGAVQLLLQRGADPNARIDGLTPLFHALELEWDVASNCSPFEPPTPKSSTILIGYGADPNLPRPDGRSLLEWLKELEYPQAVELLTRAGAW